LGPLVAGDDGCAKQLPRVRAQTNNSRRNPKGRGDFDFMGLG
jgi:hypothetical protein